MNDLEKATELLKELPSEKLGFVIAYMQGMMVDSDNEYCLQLLKDYEEDTDLEKDQEYFLEECEREWGLI